MILVLYSEQFFHQLLWLLGIAALDISHHAFRALGAMMMASEILVAVGTALGVSCAVA